MLYVTKATEYNVIRTANDDCMKVQGVGKLNIVFLSRGEPLILNPDRVILVEGLAALRFSL